MARKFQPPPEALIATAAELRAAGTIWEQVAEKVNRSPETVRRWPNVYAAVWTKHYQAARKQLVADATAESVVTLRRHLRDEDEKVSRGAADSLIKLHIAEKPKRATRRTRSRLSTDGARVAAYIEGLTDAEIDALVRDLAPAAAGPDPAADAANGAA